MKKPLILAVLGTRPEAIKLAPVVRALQKRGRVSVKVCSTGQHRSMLDSALEAFALKVDYDLNLMRPGHALNAFGARALERVGALLERLKPAFVLVQGDTTTALMGALAAFHQRVPVGHVEAGLRTLDLSDPFPEEANRLIIDAVASLLFAPTARARTALLAEGRPAAKILVTGNTVIDAARWAAAHPRPPETPELIGALAEAGRQPVVLVTMHRRESFDGAMAAVCGGLRKLLDRHRELRIVFPVHLNPKVQEIVRKTLRHPRARLLPALGYFDFIHLLGRCRFVMTDSGGVLEEASALGKPVLVLRRLTERPEAVRAGAARVAGLKPERIVALASRLLGDPAAYRRMARPAAVFGDGRASERIARAVERFLRLI